MCFSTYFYTQKSSLNFFCLPVWDCFFRKGNFSVEIYCLSLIKRHVEAIKSERTDYRTVNKRFNKKSALCRVVVYIDFLFLSSLSTIEYRRENGNEKCIYRVKTLGLVGGRSGKSSVCSEHLGN